jgi:hypothetical protein
VASYDRCVECSAGDPLRARAQSTPTTQLGLFWNIEIQRNLFFFIKNKENKMLAFERIWRILDAWIEPSQTAQITQETASMENFKRN